MEGKLLNDMIMNMSFSFCVCLDASTMSSIPTKSLCQYQLLWSTCFSAKKNWNALLEGAVNGCEIRII